MSFWIDDLDIFFSDFGEEAIFGATTIKVIFHNAYEAVALFNSEIESKNPYVEVKNSDVAGIVHGDTLTIGSVVYKVQGIQPDGTGITTLILSYSTGSGLGKGDLGEGPLGG